MYINIFRQHITGDRRRYKEIGYRRIDNRDVKR